MRAKVIVLRDNASIYYGKHIPNMVMKKAKRISIKTRSTVTVSICRMCHESYKVSMEYEIYPTQIEHKFHIDRYDDRDKQIIIRSKGKSTDIKKPGVAFDTHVFEEEWFNKSFDVKHRYENIKTVYEQLTPQENIYDQSLVFNKESIYNNGKLDKQVVYGLRPDVHWVVVAIEVYTNKYGNMQFLCKQINETLMYVPLNNKYCYRGNLYTREEAIAYFDSIINIEFYKDDIKNKSKIFLEAINNHTP